MTVPKGEKYSCVRARWIIILLLLDVFSVDIIVVLFFFYFILFFGLGSIGCEVVKLDSYIVDRHVTIMNGKNLWRFHMPKSESKCPYTDTHDNSLTPPSFNHCKYQHHRPFSRLLCYLLLRLLHENATKGNEFNVRLRIINCVPLVGKHQLDMIGRCTEERLGLESYG